MDLSSLAPRRLDFATVRELALYFSRNQTRASYAAVGLLYPSALGLTPQQVDARFRSVGNLHDLGGWLYEAGHRVGVDEVVLAEQIGPLWERLVAQAFPSDAEVNAEVGNS